MRIRKRGDCFGGGEVLHLVLDEVVVERVHEREDARVGSMVLPEGFEIPGQEDELPHRLAHPGGVGVRHQRPAVPFPVAEPVTDIVTELVMPGEESHDFVRIPIEMRRLPPAHHPGPPVHDGALEAAQLQLEIDVVRHEHLGGIRHRDRLLERLFELSLPPGHSLGEGRDIEIEDEGVVGFDRHQLHVRVADQFLEAGKHVRPKAPHLQQQRDREAEGDLHPLVDQRLEQLGGRTVAVFGHLVEIAPVHLLVEDERVHLFRRGAAGNQLRGEADPPRLMRDHINDQGIRHELYPLIA